MKGVRGSSPPSNGDGILLLDLIHHPPTSAPAPAIRGRTRGFTIIELLVVMAIIVVLVGIMLAVVRKTRTSAESLQCLSNLRQITTGLRMWAGDNGNRFPDPGAVGVSWESMLDKYLTNKRLFYCPADSELSPTIGSSYDWRDTGDPETTIAGKLMTDAHRNIVLTMEALPGWHSPRKMNVGRLDGSCCTENDRDAIADLLKPLHN